MSVPSHQLAIKTLVLAIDAVPELTADAKRIAFLHGIPHEGFERFKDILDCDQGFKPRATLLEQGGYKTNEKLEGPYDVVFLLPERQREQALGDMARGLDLLREGGVLIVSMHNDWGAKRFESHLKEAAGEVHNISKYHCRVFWTTKKAKVNEPLLESWRDAAAAKRYVNETFWSKPGLFAWDRIDIGSQFLIEKLPPNISGTVADLGSGWGFLSQHLLHTYPDIRSLDAYEADRDGVEATRRNMGNVKVSARARALWHDVTGGVEPRHYDFIIMNPPFHDGREPTPELGMKFLATAAEGLRSQGELWLVANRHLPYEALMEEVFADTSLVAQSDNFKVMRGSFPRHELFFKRGRRSK